MVAHHLGPDFQRLPLSRNSEGEIDLVLTHGRVVVFSAWANGTQLLYRRAIGSRALYPIVGTEGAAMPFWSADSRFVGFHASGLLKRVERTDTKRARPDS